MGGDDLRERLLRAEKSLLGLMETADAKESARLHAKATGVALARSYVEEYLRDEARRMEVDA